MVTDLSQGHLADGGRGWGGNAGPLPPTPMLFTASVSVSWSPRKTENSETCERCMAALQPQTPAWSAWRAFVAPLFLNLGPCPPPCDHLLVARRGAGVPRCTGKAGALAQGKLPASPGSFAEHIGARSGPGSVLGLGIPLASWSWLCSWGIRPTHGRPG